VEHSLCLLVFMLMTLGAMEFAWAIYAYNFCAFAAQDAAHWASVHGSLSPSPATQATVASYVQSEAVGLNWSLMTVVATWSPDNNPGSRVNIAVGYTINPLTGLAIKSPLQVSSTAQVVIVH
jgi:Flp pilus assembly protein TadG